MDPERANHGLSIGHPTSVGVYPRGRTPEGVDDLAGNVWEWCFDWYGPYAKGRRQNPTGAAQARNRVSRGGSWFYSFEDFVARPAGRNRNHPDYRFANVGFRVVAGRDVRTF
jgi:formylglycine-generating enzyme required for sulfatase activity